MLAPDKRPAGGAAVWFGLLALAACVALLIRSDIIVLLFTSQLLGELGGLVEAELELATELQLPVLRDKSVGSLSLAATTDAATG